MDDAGEVEMLDAAEHLVEEVGHALVVQIHVDHLAQVGVHQLHHDVEVEEVLQRLLRRERIQKADDLNAVGEHGFHQLDESLINTGRMYSRFCDSLASSV